MHMWHIKFKNQANYSKRYTTEHKKDQRYHTTVECHSDAHVHMFVWPDSHPRFSPRIPTPDPHPRFSCPLHGPLHPLCAPPQAIAATSYIHTYMNASLLIIAASPHSLVIATVAVVAGTAIIAGALVNVRIRAWQWMKRTIHMPTAKRDGCAAMGHASLSGATYTRILKCRPSLELAVGRYQILEGMFNRRGAGGYGTASYYEAGARNLSMRRDLQESCHTIYI